MFTSDDTITAISSAAGSAPRAIVRLSGPDAYRLAGGLFTAECGRRLDEIGGFRSIDGIVSFGDNGGIELPARAYVFRSGRSYTRQDVVELHVPGPAAVATMLQANLIEAGARAAQAGEFTARAFFSGRIDLSAAGAVADVINAADDAQLKSAVLALNGRIFNFCKKSSDSLVEILACVEASIDLADEGIVLDTPAHQAERLRDLCDTMLSTAERSAEIPDTAERVHVVLAGLTNVGKSSVLNAMTATSRAMVSALAGTTRDVLSASTTIGGSAVVVQDAAGFTTATNPIDIAADIAAKRAIGRGDAILMVVDITAKSFQPDCELLDEIRRINHSAPLLVLANKADLVRPADLLTNLERLRQMMSLDSLATSAVTSLGLERVKETLADMLHLKATRSGQSMGLHLRQKQCLIAAAGACERAAELLRPADELSDVAEIVAIELRQALEQLGRISGQVVNEDILAQIFHRFCVGK